jgi:ATP sulfurylase
LREHEADLAKTASEAFGVTVVPIVLLTQEGDIKTELLVQDYSIVDLIYTMYPEGIE